MRFIKDLPGRFYVSYFLLMFIITMLPAYIAVVCIYRNPEPLRSKRLHRIFRVWMGIFMPSVFCRVKTTGEEYFNSGENYVVVCNHCSFIDIPVSSAWIPQPLKTLAKIEFAKTPLFGRIYKAGTILVDRKSEQSRKDSFSAMRRTLQMGLSLCLYPEGTRNKTGKSLQEFQDGAFIVAIREQKAILPAIIFNTGKILPHNKTFWAKPMSIPFHFLPPISTSGMTLKDLPELKNKVWAIMNSYYTQHYH